MIKWFVNVVSKNSEDGRSKIGTTLGFLGIFFNFVLFLLKLVSGIIANSAAIIADAFNNLSDMGSSVITFIGFKMAGKPADKDHPYGHGRIEYIAGLFVSIIIIFVGLELAKASFEKIISPEEVQYGVMSVVILFVSIAVKLFMYFLYNGAGNEIKSSALKATAADSFNDCIATFTVLLGVFASYLFEFKLDGILGLFVAVFIIVSGVKSVLETINPVLGEGADPKLVEMIKKEVTKDDRILGIHDLCVHNYGPSKILLSLHAEVSSKGNVLELHDMIDNIEKELKIKFNCEAVIHMDPIVIDDERTNKMRAVVKNIIKEIDDSLNMHDFRMTDGHTHTNLIFDVVVPFGFKYSDLRLMELIEEKIKMLDGNYFAVINVDKE